MGPPAGEEGAALHPIERFYRQYRDDVYRYLLGLARDPILAEDLLSETFLEALRALPAFRGESSAKTWLFGIARNVWLRQLQKGRAHAPLDERLGLYLADGLDDLCRRQTLARIGELLRQRGDPAETVVRMRADGWPYAEIAGRLQISEASARVIDFRTKRWLRSALEKEGLL